MSSTGMTTSISSGLRTPASTTVTGRGRRTPSSPIAVPPRKRAISSSGRCVADRPIRCGDGRPPWRTQWSRRSRVTARWLPRLVAARAWISSTITASTPRSVSRAADVSMRYSDSGVVMRMSGGLRTRLRRSSAGVSPVRMPTVGSVYACAEPLGREPDALERAPQVLLDVDRQRAQRRHVHDAGAVRSLGRRRLAGEPVDAPQEGRQRLAGAGGRQDQRVLAAGDGRPALRLRRASASGNEVLNHARTAGENGSSGSGAATDQGYRRPLTGPVRDRAGHGGLAAATVSVPTMFGWMSQTYS